MRNPHTLAVYRAARRLVTEVYKLLTTMPRNEEFNLTSQMRRSVTSIRDNIRDGCSCQSDSAMLPYLYHALSSAEELEDQLEQACDVGVGDTRTANRLKHDAGHEAVMLTHYITTVESDLGIPSQLKYRKRRRPRPKAAHRPARRKPRALGGEPA
jgi:four helix bundle protein